MFGLGAEIGKHLSLPEYFLGREQCVPFFNLSLVLTNDKSLRKQLLVCLKQLFKHCPEAAQSELMHVLLKKIFPLAHSRKHSVDLSEYFNFLASVLHNANSSLLQQYFCV